MSSTKAALLSKLKAAEDQNGELRALLATIPTLVWRADAEGNAEFFNQRWHEYTGLTVAEARGSGWMAAFHPDDAQMIARHWIELIASQFSNELETRFRRHDGEYRWHLIRSEPILDDQGRVIGWCGSNTDVEGLKRAESDLRRSTIFLENTQHLSQTGGVGFRLSSEDIFWSKETARIYGYDSDVIPTKELFLQRVHPEDVKTLVGVFEAATQGGAMLDFEHRLLMPDGSTKYVRNLAQYVFDAAGHEEVSGAVMDITEQHHAKAALTEALETIRLSEVKLRKTIDTIPSLAWSSPENGMGDFFSKRWLDYTGLSLEQAQGTGWVVAIHPDDLQALADAWTRIRASGKEGEIEARLRRFDGTYRWFLFRAAPLRDPDGFDLVWYGTNTDIDDLKRAEAELRQREADLRKAQAELAHVTRVSTLGELTASIAHEISQPIAGVVLNANACVRWLSGLDGETRSVKGAQEALQRIVRDGSRAGDVIARVRDLFKKTEMAKVRLDLNELIEEVISLSRMEIDKRRIDLRLKLAPKLPGFLGDRVQIQQVVINLIMNGMEAMSDVAPSNRKLVIETRSDGPDRVLTTVSDAGAGFGSADIEKLFIAFHSSKSDGLGIGLSISRSIIENHGGRLWGEENPGSGARFNFTIPALLPSA